MTIAAASTTITIIAKYRGRCALCQQPFAAGTEITYNRADRTARHVGLCLEAQARASVVARAISATYAGRCVRCGCEFPESTPIQRATEGWAHAGECPRGVTTANVATRTVAHRTRRNESDSACFVCGAPTYGLRNSEHATCQDHYDVGE